MVGGGGSLGVKFLCNVVLAACVLRRSKPSEVRAEKVVGSCLFCLFFKRCDTCWTSTYRMILPSRLVVVGG